MNMASPPPSGPSGPLLFGGTFDPPHRAHAELCAAVAARLGCDGIILIPAAMNPLKGEPPAASGAHRVAMLRLIAARLRGARISTIELDRGGPSYFVDTLEAIRAEVERVEGGDTALRFLMGADQALEFHAWKNAPRILELATPVVLLRAPMDEAAFVDRMTRLHDADEGARWKSWTVATEQIDVSSTEIRSRLRAGRDVTDMLPADVIAYIQEHGLYT